MLFKSIVMRTKFLYYPFLLCLLAFVACDTEQANSSIKPSPAKEDTVEKKPDAILEELDEKTGIQNQTIWHSPRMLIQSLGDLSTKTVANIGAGPYGYFSFQIADEAKKVIAIDIAPTAIQFIDSMRLQLLPASMQDKLETRLVTPENPKLRFEEADVVTIMDTYAYIPNRINYLKNLRQGIKQGGKLLIVDFKMRKLPIGPPQSEKVPLYQVELDLEEAGFQIEVVDDRSLEYQYMLLATNN
jgi:2-polyprenyl-3-methyl-5-hydroxy-6-metoxy-1,4-benzoquinol methylase